MDDAQRFLRYLIPGTVFFIVTALGLFVFWPEWVLDFRQRLDSKSAESVLFIALGFIVTSGALGFLLSMVHHVLSWKFRFYGVAPNYVKKVKEWHPLISERLTKSGETERVMEAWMIVTKLWHERVKTDERIESANDRADRNSHLVHSVGACRVAVWAAVIASLVISANKLAEEPSVSHSGKLILAFGAAVGVGILFYVCETSYRQVLAQSSDFVLRVLEDALKFPQPKQSKIAAEQPNAPVSATSPRTFTYIAQANNAFYAFSENEGSVQLPRTQT
jgi:hypothetical protein